MTVDYRGPGLLRAWSEDPRLAWWQRVTQLHLRGPGFDDRLVPHLARLRHVQRLELARTRVSASGLAQLRDALGEGVVRRVGLTAPRLDATLPAGSPVDRAAGLPGV